MKLEESFGFNISKVAQRMDARFSKSLEVFDINSRDYGILLTILNYSPLTQIQVGELMAVDRTTIGQLIDSLETKGLLRRQKNPKDRRQNLILLSEEGDNLVKQMWLTMQTIEYDVIKNLQDTQEVTFLTISRIIAEGKGNGKN